jgi:SAM-dependent methyltransferase
MVTGIDIAAPMISAARRRVRDPEIEWIVGDAETYPLAVAVDIACEVLLVQLQAGRGRKDCRNRH